MRAYTYDSEAAAVELREAHARLRGWPRGGTRWHSHLLRHPDGTRWAVEATDLSVAWHSSASRDDLEATAVAQLEAEGRDPEVLEVTEADWETIASAPAAADLDDSWFPQD